MRTSIVIASAAWTAVGSFNGVSANVSAHDLGGAVIRGLLEGSGVDPSGVNEAMHAGGSEV